MTVATRSAARCAHIWLEPLAAELGEDAFAARRATGARPSASTPSAAICASSRCETVPIAAATASAQSNTGAIRPLRVAAMRTGSGVGKRRQPDIDRQPQQRVFRDEGRRRIAGRRVARRGR